jgi:hypothetical protein
MFVEAAARLRPMRQQFTSSESGVLRTEQTRDFLHRAVPAESAIFTQSVLLSFHDCDVTRDALGGLLLGAGVLGLSVYAPAPANAGFFGLGGDDVTAALDELSNLRVKVEEVLSALKKKELKGGKEDSATVIRYSATYFQPLQGGWVLVPPGSDICMHF